MKIELETTRNAGRVTRIPFGWASDAGRTLDNESPTHLLGLAGQGATKAVPETVPMTGHSRDR